MWWKLSVLLPSPSLCLLWKTGIIKLPYVWYLCCLIYEMVTVIDLYCILLNNNENNSRKQKFPKFKLNWNLFLFLLLLQRLFLKLKFSKQYATIKLFSFDSKCKSKRKTKMIKKVNCCFYLFYVKYRLCLFCFKSIYTFYASAGN